MTHQLQYYIYKEKLKHTSTQKQASRGGTSVKNLPVNTGDAGNAVSVPGLGRSPGVGNGNPLQYPYPVNSMDVGSSLWGHKEPEMIKHTPHTNVYISIQSSNTHNNQKMGKKPMIPKLMDKMWYSHTMEYYSVIKRNEFLLFLSSSKQRNELPIHSKMWMNLKHTKISERVQ